MGLSVNNNIAAMNSYRNLSVTDSQMSKSLEKLSSGFRINRAADDAAGLAISEGLRSQIGGLKVAVRNTQDGISVVQTAEGALTEVHSILQRVRDLAVQAGNDSNNAAARANIKTESDSLVSELDRIGKSTNFNGTKLLDGSAGTLNFQVGANGDVNSKIAVDLSGANVSGIATTLGSTATVAGSTKFALATAPVYTGALTFSFNTDSAATDSNFSVTLAADATRDSATELADALNANAVFKESMTASVLKDADGKSTHIEVRAKDGSTVHGGVIGTAATPNATVFATGDGTVVAGTGGGIAFDTNQKAQDSIALIDLQISAVSTARAKLGALQNRFEHTVNNLNVSVENLSASESRIRDTDMAQEMTNFTRTQILTQAGTSMLAQANQAPQGILKLLG
jgi:flagellin